MASQKPLSVAIVGSGLAGLTAAHLLSSYGTKNVGGLQIEVHLFEKTSTLGMDSHSVTVAAGSPHERRVDVPMRSFQGGYYKQVIALYRRLGVKFRQADFSYSFSFLTGGGKTERPFDLRTYFIYNGSSGRKGVSLPLNGQSPQKQSPANIFFTHLAFILSTLFMLFNYIQICILSAPLLRPGPAVTFGEWTVQTTPRGPLARWMRLDASWRDFTQNVLLPMFSAVCTAPRDDIYAHPVAELLEYVWLTIGTHHYVVQHGVRDVVTRLSRGLQHIHLSSPIVSIELDPSDAGTFSVKTPTETYTGFSHLILATQANHAASLLASYHSSLSEDPSGHRQAVAELIKCLETFQYRRTVVINHRDDSFLSPDERDRRDLNLTQWKGSTAGEPELEEKNTWTVPSSYTMATHILRDSSQDAPLYQTTNPMIAPRLGQVLSASLLERAIVTVESKRALRGLSVQRERWWPMTHTAESSLGHLQGGGRLRLSTRPGIWVCGSYAHAGIPLLEGCVASARNVVEQGVLRSEGVATGDAVW